MHSGLPVYPLLLNRHVSMYANPIRGIEDTFGEEITIILHKPKPSRVSLVSPP